MILHLVFIVKLEEMRDEMGIAIREKYCWIFCHVATIYEISLAKVTGNAMQY